MELVTDRPRAGARPGELGWLPLPPIEKDVLLTALVVLLYRHTGEPDVQLALALTDRPAGRLRVLLDPAEPVGALHARVGLSTPEPSQVGLPVLFTDQPAGTAAELVLRADRLGYQPALFDRASAVRLAGQLARIARADPATPVADLDLLDEAERRLVRDRFNDTDRPYPREATVHQLFAEQAARCPDAPAVSDQHTVLSYAELDQRSDRLAARLRAAGVRPGDPVGLLVARSPAMVVATLGILKAGGCYLPIDPGYPADRIAFQLSDSGASALVSDLDRTVDFAGPVLDLEAELGDSAAAASADLSDQTADDIAYLMYTSGTTGRPKGVQVRHRGVVRLVRNPDYLDFGPDTRMLAISSICFDAATFELWGPLLNGGSVHLAGPDAVLDAGVLGRLLADRAISTLLLIAPVFNHLVEQDPTVFRPLRELMVGGDALSARHLAAVMDGCPDLVLINGYGPTENTTLGTTHRLGRADLARVPIGRPVANSRCYVLDPAGRLCPIGLPGELFLGGDGVARGYRNRPELTAAAFRPDPFRPNGLMFGTGDLARWRPDGVLEFFGRRDRQVKVRGFRIELGEVEHALRTHPAVAEAVVLDRPRGADRYLVGYHVADRELPPTELRAHLRTLLPEHMLPAVFVQLPAMPLNTSGKIALDRLPASPEPTTRPEPDGEPGGLLGLIRTVLGTDAVGPDDELPDLGVDSFAAAVLANRIAAEFGVRLPAGQLLRAGPVRRLAELVDGAAPTGEPVPNRAPDAADYPLSPQQRRLYVEQLKDPAAVHYNVPVRVPLPAGLSRDRLAAALGRLAERHEALRTEFVLHGGEVRQRIVPAIRPELSTGEQLVPLPFELGRAPLWRAVVTPETDTLLLDLHHIITDGVSLAVLVADLLELCAGNQPPAPPLRYRDYACHLAGPDGVARRAAQREHWQQVFAGPRRRPDLPLDEPRPPIRSVAGGELAFRIDRPRSDGLRELARRTGGTLFTVLAAGYAALLAELCGEPDVTIGTPTAGRTVPGTDRVVGIFASTVCLRVHARPELAFDALVRSVTEAAEQATAHQDYPLESLAAELEPGRDYRRHPLFDALIAFHSARYLTVRAAGQTVPLRPLWNGQAPFDLNLQIYEEPDGLRASLQYGARVLRPATVAGWRDRWLDLLDAAIAEPSMRLAALAAAGRGVPDLEFDL
ncbi:MAG TPA: amino acid adenylation domain-containing protein [Jatrophihabitans sp.]|nr:amino acid adenylation domain-containing protein [Jatrophihabitans sp.]